MLFLPPCLFLAFLLPGTLGCKVCAGRELGLLSWSFCLNEQLPLFSISSLFFFSFCFTFPTYCHHLKWSCSCVYLFIIRFYPNKMLIPWEQRSRCLVFCWMPWTGIEDSQETLVQWTDGFYREKIPMGFLRGGQLYRGKMYGLCPQGLCQEGKETQGLRMFAGI